MDLKLSVAESIKMTLKTRRPSRVFRDDGVWVQQDRHGVIVNWKPKPKWSLPRFESKAEEFFCYVYRPKPGDVVIDVGAGVGSEAWYFAKAVGAQGRVVAVEAHPLTYLCLTKFCGYNHLENVTPMHVAISDRHGEVRISGGDKHLSNTIVNAASGVAVKAMPLDALVDQLGLKSIDFIKMNIEGAEKLAIRGMTQTLGKTRVVCISCHDFVADRSGDDDMRTKAAVRAFLVEQGFEIVSRDHDPRPFVRDQINAIHRGRSP